MGPPIELPIGSRELQGHQCNQERFVHRCGDSVKHLVKHHRAGSHGSSSTEAKKKANWAIPSQLDGAPPSTSCTQLICDGIQNPARSLLNSWGSSNLSGPVDSTKNKQSDRRAMHSHWSKTMASRRWTTVAALLAAWLGALGVVLVEVQAARPLSQSLGPCSLPLFVFGASYTDVGENAVAWPLRDVSNFEPYGLDFFGKPSGRFSNGRLIIDHISQGLGQELMKPYLRDVGSFQRGVNFASAGSTAINYTFLEGKYFSLSHQVDQFRDFHRRSLDMHQSKRAAGAALRFPAPKDFALGVYIIESGSNDYQYPNESQFDSAKIPLIIESIEEALQGLYSEGARNFVVMDSFPGGCFPMALTRVYTLDEDGCAIEKMKLLALHNTGLRAMVAKLNAELLGANVVVFSMHEIFMNAIRNPSIFGLKHVYEACCGSPVVWCGKSVIVDGVPLNYSVCENRSEYMLWDGIHPTDAFAYHIAQAFLRGEHMQPSFHIREMCWPYKSSL